MQPRIGGETFGVVDDHEIDHLRDGEGEERDVRPSEPQAREPDQHRDHDGEQTRGRHGEPQRPAKIIAQHRRPIGAAGEERHLSQREYAADAQNEIPLRDDGGPDEEQRELGDDITVGESQWRDGREGEQDQADEEIAARLAHSRTILALPKKPAGRQMRTAITSSSSRAKPNRTPSKYCAAASSNPITIAAATAP
jgi:hypothetical protein